MSNFALRIMSFLGGGDSRFRILVATAGASYLGRFGMGIVMLVTLPMARRNLDPELFGVWMMLTALLGFMAFADLGIGNGVLNKTTQAKASGDVVALRRVLVSGYACTSLVGVAVYLLWLLWVQLSATPSAIAGVILEANRAEVLQAFHVFAAVLAINIPASLIQRVQLGMQQGYWIGIAQFINAVIVLVAVPLTLWHGGGLPELVMATLGVQALVNIVNTVVWLARSNLLKGVWGDCRRGELHLDTVVSLLRTGGLFFILQIAAAFAFQSDSIVITQTLGQQAYGDFAVVQRLFLFISMIMNVAMVSLWPAFGDAIASNNTAWAVRVLQRTMVVAALLALAGTVLLSVAMPWLMANWLNVSWTPSWGLLAVLSAWTIVEAISAVTAAYMNGANILRLQVIFAILMAATAFGIKWILTPRYGATGSVLGTLLAYSVVSIPGQIYVFRRIFKNKD